MRGEVLVIVPKSMQSIDWRQSEEWQRHRCKYLRVFGSVGTCVTLDATSVNSGPEEKLSHTLTHPNKEQRALCVFASSRGKTHPQKSDHFVSNTTWSHSSPCSSEIKLQHQKGEDKEPFLTFYRTCWTRTTQTPVNVFDRTESWRF